MTNGKDGINLDESKIVKVYNARDDIEAELIIDALKEQNIFCNTQESGIGDWMRTTQGFSVYGVDIFVLEENEMLARGIIDEVLSGIENIDISDEFGSDNDGGDAEGYDEPYKLPWYRNKKLIVRAYLIFGAVTLALMILYIVINYGF